MKSKRHFAMAGYAIISLVLAAPALAEETGKVAVFKIKGPVAEAPQAVDFAFPLGEDPGTNMFDLLAKLRQARGDHDLDAVVFDIQQAHLGLAQIQELRKQFEALRAADKDVWIFCETLRPGTLLLGSAAGRLVMMPTGLLDFSGLYAEALYFKNLLDKLGVEADIIHCGAYKSAGEALYRTGPSKEDEEQNNRILDSIFTQVIEGIAESRRLSADKVRTLVDKGLFSAQEALEAKLVDKVQYREDFIKSLKKRYGKDVKVVRDYGDKKGPQIDFGNPFAFFQVFSDMMKGKDESDKPAIAVVYVEGLITSGKTEQSLFGGSSNAGSDTIRKAIAMAAKDRSVKALILRVDSPGGSAIASDVICEATKRFKKTGRPVVVSMGNVAASGGYYVSALADTLFAEPGTLTGSIGVVGGKLVTQGFWDWAGVTGHEYKRGKHADFMNTNRRFSDGERELIQGLMDRVYGEFKDRVLEGRRDRIQGELESLAGGRVYTGEQALGIGLVDQLGGMADAVKFAADETDMSKYELRVFPRPKSFFDLLAEAFGGKEKDEEFVIVPSREGAAGGKLSRLPSVAVTLEAVRTLDPVKARSMERTLIQLEMLSTERVLMIGPSVTMMHW